MKERNKKLIIIVSCLIVIVVVSISFAYFSSKTSVSGEGSQTIVEMATPGNTTLRVEGTIEFNDLDILPGHKNISSLKVTAIGEEEVKFNIIWTGTNTINTPIKYYVYKSITKENPSITCEKKEEIVSGAKMLYEECTNNNFDNIGSVISSGEITNNEEEIKYILKDQEVIEANPDGNTVYYYVVLEYPNLDEDQYEVDKDGKFSGEVNVEVLSSSAINPVINNTTTSATANSITVGVEATDNSGIGNYYYSIDDGEYTKVSEGTYTFTNLKEYTNYKIKVYVDDIYGNQSEIKELTVRTEDASNPELTITTSNETPGDNDWYKSITIVGTGEDSGSGVSSIKYCTTTSSTCTPTTEVASQTASVALSSNASAQKVCFQVIDNSGKTSEITCSGTYKVDNTVPTATISSTSSTKNTITVNVSGSDAHSGIQSYKYSINNGAYVQTTSNTHTFTGLSSYTTYSIKVQVVDKAGNVSSEVTGNVATKDGTAPTQNFSIASSTAGSNGWYKALSVKVTASDNQSGVTNIKYCTTTSSSACTPSTTVSGTTATVALNSNASSQKVCANATDKDGNTSSTTCSSTYNVDNVIPTISITSTSVTQNSISVTVKGNDAHSGIYQYKFSSNGGSSYTTVSTTSSSYTYTINGLSAGTAYNVAVQAVDKAGNVSSVVTKSVTTEKTLCDGEACNIILANYPTQLKRTNFTITVTNTTTGTIYYEDTSKGRTYYFAGNPTDNWVKFAGFYWRIIRINEDGTIRMIYQGTSANSTGSGTVLHRSDFNDRDNNNMYVGYMYTANQVHGLGTNSTIKGVLDSWWYTSNLSSYASKIDGNAGFCGDREPSTSDTTSNGSGGTGNTRTYYGAQIRLYNNLKPTFECANNSDLYTTIGSQNGNKALTYPIGLISMDEVWYAGGYTSSNTSYYLYINENYWTITPGYFNSKNAGVFYVSIDGRLFSYVVNISYYVRPVINLKADVKITGAGTSSNPYIVS